MQDLRLQIKDKKGLFPTKSEISKSNTVNSECQVREYNYNNNRPI